MSRSSPSSAASTYPYAAATPIAGRAADRERPDRVGHLGGGLAAELDFLVRKPALVEQDDRTGFQTNDLLGA